MNPIRPACFPVPLTSVKPGVDMPKGDMVIIQAPQAQAPAATQNQGPNLLDAMLSALSGPAGIVGYAVKTLLNWFAPKQPELAKPAPDAGTVTVIGGGAGVEAAPAPAVEEEPVKSQEDLLKDAIFETMTEVWGTDAYCNDTSFKWWKGQLKLFKGDFDALKDKMVDYKKSIDAYHQ